jgi:hypothetical protein
MSKNNKQISIVTKQNQNKSEENPLEILKSKYVLANTIKSNKTSTKLSKSRNSVVSDKNFVGYNEDDYENVEKMCKMNNVNMFIKNESKLFGNVSCGQNLYVTSGTLLGYKDDELLELNNNKNLYVKGDSELNGNLFVKQNINLDKNIHVQQSVNIGFENEPFDNTSRLNVNGNSEFVGDNVVYGSQYVKNNLIVNDKANFYNDIFLSNSISLETEHIQNVTITNNTILPEHYKLLLKNILHSAQNYNQAESSVLKFYSKTNNNFYSGLISASKNFIIKNIKNMENNSVFESDENILAFVLVYAIYSNSKIISVKPVLDTFVLIDSEENTIKIENLNLQINSKSQTNYPNSSEKSAENCKLNTTQQNENSTLYSTSNSIQNSIQNSISKTNSKPKIENESNSCINTNSSFFSTSLDILMNNKLVNLLKIQNEQSEDNEDIEAGVINLENVKYVEDIKDIEKKSLNFVNQESEKHKKNQYNSTSQSQKKSNIVNRLNKTKKNKKSALKMSSDFNSDFNSDFDSDFNSNSDSVFDSDSAFDSDFDSCKQEISLEAFEIVK